MSAVADDAAHAAALPSCECCIATKPVLLSGENIVQTDNCCESAPVIGVPIACRESKDRDNCGGCCGGTTGTSLDMLQQRSKQSEEEKSADRCCYTGPCNQYYTAEILKPRELGGCCSGISRACEESAEPRKPDSCCNAACVDIAARRQCKAQCNEAGRECALGNHEISTGTVIRESGCSSSIDSTSEVRKSCKNKCDENVKDLRERYAATLEALGCICRALLARNLETCCSFGKAPEKQRSTSSIYSPKTSIESRPSVKSNKCSLKRAGCCKKPVDSGTWEAKQSVCCGTGVNTAVPNPGVIDENGAACALQKSCYSNNQQAAQGSSRLLARNPCDDDAYREKIDVVCSTSLDLAHHDIEKKQSATEHVTLSVEGLTCVGCESKLFRCLNAIRGVRNLQTSLVMAQADFEIDTDAASVDKLIREVAKSTGFTCQRLRTQGQGFEIRIPGDARDFVNQKLPLGVEDMIAIDRHTVRIVYNAKLVGARDLLEQSFGHNNVTLAPIRASSDSEAGSKHVRQTAYMTAFSALLTIPVLVLAWAPLPPHKILYGSVSLALATIVQFVVAGPFYPSAFKALLFTRVIEMDLLIVLSTSTAYIFSVVAFGYQVQRRPLSTGEFFETSTLLVTLIMVGRLASAFARQKAVEIISVRSLQTGTAFLVGPIEHVCEEIDARLLQYGDRFKVLPDSRIPTDGIVVSGESDVDESSLTGEAIPVGKLIGSHVIAGCVNGSGTLVVRLRRLPGENTISDIATMVDAAKFSKPKIQHLADRVASFFVPAVVAFTLITFGAWIAVGKAIQNKSISSSVVHALTFAISVLIVSCPCAIGLAVPMVVVTAGGVSARHGVIFKAAETIEIARNVSHVVLDKTGTLTEGRLSVSAEKYCVGNRQSQAMSVALGLTLDSKHPVSSAVAAHLLARNTMPALVENLKSITGKGLEGYLDAAKVRGGNCRWLAVENSPDVAHMLSQGLTVFCVMLNEELVAVFGLTDSLRPDAKSVVLELQKRGLAVSLVSGDDDGAVQRVGLELGISSSHIRSQASPREKQEYVKALMTGPARVVMFCGDGTNDAIALAQADIGVHMNSGTDVAQNAADAVLVRPALTGILVLIDISLAAFRRIVFNFCWSFVYNVVAVLLAAGAFVDVRIPPQYAGLGEIVSVLPVILIALQLRWFKME